MHEFPFVHEPITEPNVDRVEPTNRLQSVEAHFFLNLSHRSIPVGLPLTHMAFRKRPLAVRVLYHGKVYQAVDTLKHKSSGGDFGSVTLTFPLIPSGGYGAPRRVVGRVWHRCLLECMARPDLERCLHYQSIVRVA